MLGCTQQVIQQLGQGQGNESILHSARGSWAQAGQGLVPSTREGVRWGMHRRSCSSSSF